MSRRARELKNGDRTQRSDIARISSNSPVIVTQAVTAVKRATAPPSPSPGNASTVRRAGRKRTRRQSHGAAWHWRQTDSWYYTLPGTKRRVPLFDDEGNRVRGVDNKQAAQLALARVKLGQGWRPEAPPASPDDVVVANVCSDYLEYCKRGVANGSLSKGHLAGSSWMLNDFCKYCGALPVAELKKAHVAIWLESHASWKSPATRRNAIAVLLAAFNYAADNQDIPNPLKGLKKPQSTPRLQSFSADDEKLLDSADTAFRNFLFAAIHTGLRPFCELARITADDVEETPRGLMWRVYSSKTKKIRKIAVRPEVAKLTKTLMKTAPRGSGVQLFRTTRGKAWAKVNGVAHFIQIRRKLGWDKDPVRKKYSCYTCRHTFAHRMLSGYWNNGVGCSIETLAELIGDTPKVAFDQYGKEWGQHYQDPLWAAIGVSPGRGKSRKPR